MRRDDRGTVTLFVLGLTVALMFLAGLSLDLWRAVADRRELASMADAAAAAGANGVDVDALRGGRVRLDPERVRALVDASLHDAQHPAMIDDETVTVADDRVAVQLRAHVRFSLLGVFLGGQRFDIAVTAVAAPRESG